MIAVLSDSLPLLAILKQMFFRFIYKTMGHSSPIISCVANVSITNPSHICNANYDQILNEFDSFYQK